MQDQGILEQKKKQKKGFCFDEFVRKNLHKQLFVKDSAKTCQCKHDDGCLYNLIIKTLKGFAFGFGAKTTINFIGILFSFKKILKNPLAIFNIFKDSVRFGCFPGSFNLVMQGVLCFLRRKNIDPKVQFFVSGFLAGFISLATRQKQNRSIWGIFLLSRGLECFYNSLVNKGVIKKRSTDYTLLFAILMSFIGGICYAYEPLCLPHGLNKFYRLVTSENQEDLDIRKCWIQIRNNQLAPSGCPAQDPMIAMLLAPKSKK